MRSTIAAPAAFLVLLSVAVPAAPPRASLPECRSGGHFPGGGDRYDAVIVRQARKRGLDPKLVKAVITVESGFSPAAVSRCGARGLMQVMPATAEGIGARSCDLSDPETNISVGTEYLASLFKTAGRRRGGKRPSRERVVRSALAAYHSGPGALSGGAWSEPTRRYVRAVLSCYAPPEGKTRPPRRAVAAR